jgi:hypothetical protein
MPTSPLTPQSKPTLAVAIVANKAADQAEKKRKSSEPTKPRTAHGITLNQLQIGMFCEVYSGNKNDPWFAEIYQIHQKKGSAKKKKEDVEKEPIGVKWIAKCEGEKNSFEYKGGSHRIWLESILNCGFDLPCGIYLKGKKKQKIAHNAKGSTKGGPIGSLKAAPVAATMTPTPKKKSSQGVFKTALPTTALAMTVVQAGTGVAAQQKKKKQEEEKFRKEKTKIQTKDAIARLKSRKQKCRDDINKYFALMQKALKDEIELEKRLAELGVHTTPSAKKKTPSKPPAPPTVVAQKKAPEKKEKLAMTTARKSAPKTAPAAAVVDDSIDSSDH